MAVVAVTAAVLTSCGAVHAAAKAPSARGLAARIPGCKHITAEKPVKMELHRVTCAFVNAHEPMAIATFASSGAERHWVADGGSPGTPHPYYQGCCVQGDLWAASVDFNQLRSSIGYRSALDPTAVEFSVIIAAIGGRQVNSAALSH